MQVLHEGNWVQMPVSELLKIVEGSAKIGARVAMEEKENEQTTISPKEAAKYLGVATSEASLHKLKNSYPEALMPRVGKKWEVNKAKLIELINGGK